MALTAAVHLALSETDARQVREKFLQLQKFHITANVRVTRI